MIYICTPSCCQKNLSTSHISICCMRVPAYTSQIHHITITTPLLLEIMIPFSEHNSDWKTLFFHVLLSDALQKTPKTYNLNVTCADFFKIFFKNNILTSKEKKKKNRCEKGYILLCVGFFKDKNTWLKIWAY